MFNETARPTGWFRGKDILGMGPLNWKVVIGFVAFHIMAAIAPFYFSWNAFFVAALLFFISGWLGITLCFHRFLTHGSFKAPDWLRYTLTFFSVLAFQGGPFDWVGTHRIHHAESDTDKDPHTPNHGFSWSHMLWMFPKKPEGLDPRRFVPDLMADPVMVFIDRFFWVPQVVLGGILYYIGHTIGGSHEALAWVLWGVGFRTVVVWHVTWSVNSAAHTWGYQDFDTGDRSTNCWWVAWLSGGEGWHNNHHQDPKSASHGMRPGQIDMTYWIIVVLSWMGLASNIQKPKVWNT